MTGPQDLGGNSLKGDTVHISAGVVGHTPVSPTPSPLTGGGVELSYLVFPSTDGRRGDGASIDDVTARQIAAALLAEFPEIGERS